MIVKSEMSSRAIFDKLSRKELHGQTPMVTHCNKQALNNFEAQARKGEPPPQQNGGNFGKYLDYDYVCFKDLLKNNVKML